MRILIINRRYIPGEAWTNRVLAYARGFAEQGCEVHLCYLIGDKKRRHYSITIPGVKVVDFWEKDGALARRSRYISLLVNLIKCKHYIQSTDCVFVYGVESYLAKVALKKTKNVFGEITEHPFMSGSNGKRLLSKHRGQLLKRLEGLFVISNSLKDYFVQNGIGEQKIHISNMFVDTNRFDGSKLANTEKYFAYCGVVSKYKDGVDTLLEAFCTFHQTYPEYKLSLVSR